MRNCRCSFTFLSLSTLFLILPIAGCDGWLDDNGPQDSIRDILGDEDEPDADDGDSDLPGGPADDDDTVVDNEPAGAPCFGREQTDADFDCDGMPDVGDSPAEDDVFFTDPNNRRVIWRVSVAPDGTVGQVRQVGLGYGDKSVHNGWLYENGQAVLYVDDFVIIEVAPGVFRVNLLNEDGDWGQFGNYCQNGVEIAPNLVAYDPACVYDAGCESEGIPAGWAMAFRAISAYTRILTDEEIDDLPLAEDNCPSIEPQ